MRISIYYHYFPHYRRGVFEALLDRETDTTSILLNGSFEEVSGIPCIKRGDLKINEIKNIWIKGFLIQPQLLREAIWPRNDIYIFLANPNFISTWIAAIFLRLWGKRIIFWGHGFFDEEKSIKNRVRTIFFGLANAFYSYGYLSKKIAKKNGFREKNLYVGFNSLDYDKQLLIRNLLSFDTHSNFHSEARTLKILCVSRLTPICRYDLLIDAIDIARRQCDFKYELVIIGDGPSRTSLENQAKEKSVQTKFVGSIYDEAIVAKWIHGADVTVSPGKIGLTSMHSLMYGTPVISHSTMHLQMPEIESLVDGFTGMFFECGNSQDLAEVLIRFPTIFSDREKTRHYCNRMIDEVYNPQKQVNVLMRAVTDLPAAEGNDAAKLFS